MAGLSGIMNALLLAIINLASASPTSEADNLRYLAMFVAAIGVFITAQNYLLSRSTQLVESCLNSVRLRLLDRILRADLLPLEGLGKPQLFYIFPKRR